MRASKDPTVGLASARTEDGVLEVALQGEWKLEGATPRWRSFVGTAKPRSVRLRAEGVSHWDTSLVVFIGEAQKWCADAGVACDPAPLPEKMRLLGGQFAESLREGPRSDRTQSLFVEVGLSTQQAMGQARDLLQFVGECWIGLRRLVLGNAGFRWLDCLSEMQKCGAMALPIVSLISFLVGDHARLFRGDRPQALRRRHLGRRPDRGRDDPGDGRHDGRRSCSRAAPGRPTRPRSAA